MPDPTRLVAAVDDALSSGAAAVLRRVGPVPLRLHTYPTLGTAERWTLRGRVVLQRQPAEASEDASGWRNLRDVLRRAAAFDVRGATVAVRLPGEDADRTARSDAEGYWTLTVDAPPGVRPDPLGWVSVPCRVVDPAPRDPAAATRRAHVQVPHPQAGFLVVSDLDDTVLRTGLTDGLTALRTTLLTNARTRLPYEGVATFYRALRAGRAGAGRGGRGGPNPIVYVSTSPWVLHDMLRDVLARRGLPMGALELADWGVEAGRWLVPAAYDAKLRRIEQALATAPDLPVVLVGDSGQQDPEIYAAVVAGHPGRVLAVYLRDVARSPERQREVREVARGLAAGAGVPVVLSPGTGRAAASAARLGLLDPAAVRGLVVGPGWEASPDA